MANETRERAQQVTAIHLYDSSTKQPFVIDDVDLISLWFESNVTSETLIRLQKRVNDSRAQKESLDSYMAITKDYKAIVKQSSEDFGIICKLLNVGNRSLIGPALHSLIRITNNLMPEEAAALARFLSGEKACCSTGIHDGLTMGYGDLDDNGFWQYPLPQAFVSAYERSIKYAKNADTLEARMETVLTWVENDFDFWSHLIGKEYKIPNAIGYEARVRDIKDTLAAVERNRP